MRLKCFFVVAEVGDGDGWIKHLTTGLQQLVFWSVVFFVTARNSLVSLCSSWLLVVTLTHRFHSFVQN